MRRLRRWLLKGLTALSLLLCLLTTVAWFRSYFVGHAVCIECSHFNFGAMTPCGTVYTDFLPDERRPLGSEALITTSTWSYTRAVKPSSGPWFYSGPPENDPMKVEDAPRIFGIRRRIISDRFQTGKFGVNAWPLHVLRNTLIGFHWSASRIPIAGAVPEHFYEITVPFWSLVLLFASLPALLLRRMISRRSAVRGGFCAECGYDLRMTPERCPECGAIPSGFGSSLPGIAKMHD